MNRPSDYQYWWGGSQFSSPNPFTSVAQPDEFNATNLETNLSGINCYRYDPYSVGSRIPPRSLPSINPLGTDVYLPSEPTSSTHHSATGVFDNISSSSDVFPAAGEAGFYDHQDTNRTNLEEEQDRVKELIEEALDLVFENLGSIEWGTITCFRNSYAALRKGLTEVPPERPKRSECEPNCPCVESKVPQIFFEKCNALNDALEKEVDTRDIVVTLVYSSPFYPHVLTMQWLHQNVDGSYNV